MLALSAPGASRSQMLSRGGAHPGYSLERKKLREGATLLPVRFHHPWEGPTSAAQMPVRDPPGAQPLLDRAALRRKSPPFRHRRYHQSHYDINRVSREETLHSAGATDSRTTERQNQSATPLCGPVPTVRWIVTPLRQPGNPTRSCVDHHCVDFVRQSARPT